LKNKTYIRHPVNYGATGRRRDRFCSDRILARLPACMALALVLW
jgi:hypothetical protein